MWKVDKLQEVNAPGADGGLAYGFNIVKEGDWKEGGGRPLVAFAYATRAEAIAAATQMRLVIERAVDVRPYHD